MARHGDADRDSTVLVTGATGFTGGCLARELRERGRRVRALVRPGTDGSGLAADGIEVAVGDITDAAAVAHACRGVDVVYHIAAVFRTAGHPDSYYADINVGGTRNVLEAASRWNVGRVVHCSTVGVHGAISEIPSDEESPFNPGDIYQETKLEAELLARRAFDGGLPGVVARPAGIYGPGDLRFLKLFKMIHSGRFRMFGSGEVPYHFTYIDDLVDGLILCGEHPAAPGGGVYILGGDGYVSLNELVRLVSEALGVPQPRGHLPLWPLMAAAVLCEQACRPFGIDPPLHKRRAEFFVKPRAFTNAKAKREIGFHPSVPLDEGLRRTARWYFDEGHVASAPSEEVATV